MVRCHRGAVMRRGFNRWQINPSTCAKLGCSLSEPTSAGHGRFFPRGQSEGSSVRNRSSLRSLDAPGASSAVMDCTTSLNQTMS